MWEGGMGDQIASTVAGAAPATDFEGIRQQIHEFIVMNFLFDGTDAALDDAASLVEQGIVDDTGVLELVLFVEDAWGLTVDQQDLLPDNFDSVYALAGYVLRRLANL
jgi:acyl carrier protein